LGWTRGRQFVAGIFIKGLPSWLPGIEPDRGRLDFQCLHEPVYPADAANIALLAQGLMHTPAPIAAPEPLMQFRDGFA
jgi:hypothetical protein